MKTLNLFLALTLVGAVSQAAVAPRNLGDAMKMMNEKLRSIAAQMGNPGMNAQSAVLADEFVEATTAAKAFLPETVTSAPAADQPVKTARYNELMDKAIDQGKKLAQAFRDNDNRTAGVLVNDLKNSRNTGHSEFRPAN